MPLKEVELPDMERFTFGCWLVVIIFLAILVAIFIYIAYVIGDVVGKLKKAYNEVQKRFGKVGVALGRLADKAATTIETKIVPALESLGPKIDVLIDESGVLVGEYLNLGVEKLRQQIISVRSNVQQLAIGNGSTNPSPTVSALTSNIAYNMNTLAC